MRVLLIFSLLLFIAGCQDGNGTSEVPQGIRPAKLMTIESVSETSLYQFTARIEAMQSIDVSFEVGGPLNRLEVREGDELKQGVLIAALDPTDFQLAVKEAEVQLKLARQDLQRKQQVLKENGIAKSQVEDAQTHFELQQVRLRKARERLNDTRLRAPFDAVVSRRYFDNFVNINPGMPVVRLLDLHKLQVVMSVPENIIATVTPEQLVRAWVAFSFAPGKEFDIAFNELRGEADALAQTYEVSFLMDNPESLNILPGMTATANIELQLDGTQQILLPASSLVPAADGSLSVWVFNPSDNHVERRLVETLAPTNQGVPVTGGLKAGDQIVIAGASHLQEGMKIRPLQ